MANNTSPYDIYHSVAPPNALAPLGALSIPFWDNVITDAQGNKFAPGYTVNENLTNLNPWNITTISTGDTTPGGVMISNSEQLAGITLSVDVHTKRGTNALTSPGKDKAAPVVTGIKPASFSIEQLIFDYANFNLLVDQIKRVWIDLIGKEKPPAHNIYNPELAMIGIHFAYLVSLSSLKAHPSGGRVMTLEFLEWTYTPKKTAANKAKQTNGQSVDAALNTIDAQDIQNRAAAALSASQPQHTPGTQTQPVSPSESAALGNALLAPSSFMTPSGTSNTKQANQ